MVLDQAIRRPETVRSGVIIGANYCVDERTLGAAVGIDPESIERDHPDVAAAFAARHDGGKSPGARIIDFLRRQNGRAGRR